MHTTKHSITHAMSKLTETYADPVGSRSLTSPSLQVHSEWGSVELVHSIADEWRQLCQEGACDAPFYRPEWIAAAIQAFGGRRRVFLLTVRDGGRLRGVLPLLENQGWTSRIRGTCLYSASLIPRFDFILGNGPDIPAAVQAAWQHLRTLPGWDVIELVNVPHQGGAEQLFATAKEEGVPTYSYEYARSPYISLSGNPPSGDFSRFGLSSRFRYHLRQGWREINKLGCLRLRRIEHADRAILEHFYGLEQKGWKGRKGTAIACNQQMRQFYDAVARGAEQFGYFSMYSLELNDAMIAAHLAFTYGGRYYPVKVAYDETFSKYGPGHLIIGQVLEECVARGLTEFDCLGDWTEAKAKWTEKVRPHLFCAIFRNTAAGRIWRGEAQWQHEMNVGVRRLLRPIVVRARAQVAKYKKRSSRPPAAPAGS